MAASPELVAARRGERGGWELACIRYGRLAGTGTSPAGADPLPYVASLRATAEVVQAPVGPAPAATAEETELVLRWLEQPGTRIVELDGAWSCPVGGAAGVRAVMEPSSRGDVVPFDRDPAPLTTSPTTTSTSPPPGTVAARGAPTLPPATASSATATAAAAS